jgi:hypothetical protein
MGIERAFRPPLALPVRIKKLADRERGVKEEMEEFS